MHLRKTSYGTLAAAVTAALALLAPFRAALADQYLWPLHGSRRLTSSFSEYRDGHYHAGIDLRSFGATGLPCLAVSDGSVVRVKIGPSGYGKALYLKLADGRTAVYAHLDQFSTPIDSLAWHYRVERETNWCDFYLPEGEWMFQVGDTVAFSGETGTDAPHLHFELRDSGERPLNPLLDIYTLPDRAAPIISGIEVVPIGPGSVTEEGPLPAFRYFRASGSKRYILPDTLQLDGVFGFAVSAWDEQGYGRYRMAPVSIELAVDGEPLFSARNEVFSYAQSAQITAEYNVLGKGPANRYFRLFPVRGATRGDRVGPGLVHRGEIEGGVTLRSGTHVGLLTISDASGNTSTAIFHFAIHDFPVIRTADRLEAAPEVVVAASDPDGGEVKVSISESLDGGTTWRETPAGLDRGYFSAAVTDSAGALYSAEVVDDEGGIVRRWFASPGYTGRRDRAFASISAGTSGDRVAVRVTTDVPLSAEPELTVAGEALEVYRGGPGSFVALAGVSGLSGETVLKFSGIDYRGYPVFTAKAARIFTLDAGASVSFALADTIEASLESPSMRWKTPVIVREVPLRDAVPAGLKAAVGPFEIDFPRESLSRPMRLRCEPDPKAGLFLWKDEKGWEFVGAPAMENGFVKVDRPGRYIYLTDGLPPVIKHVALEKTHEGSGFFRPYFCSVPVEDGGAGVDPYGAEAWIGGIRVVCEWDAPRDRLVIPVPASFPAGRTVLSVEVSDRVGNRSVGEFGFVLE